MIILKIGGSAITKKDAQEPTIDEVNLDRIAQEVSAYNDDMVIVHGAGSYGHIYAKKFGIIEKVLSEEKIGKKEFFNYIGKALCRELTELAKETDLVEKRYERFRKIGADAKTREQMKL